MKLTVEIEGKTFEDILHGMTMVRLGVRKNHCGVDAHRGASYNWKMEHDVDTAVEHLIEVIKTWAKSKHIGTDCSYHTQKEWREKNEQYCNHGWMVMTFEGPFNHMMNCHEGYLPLYEEFHQLIKDQGWWFEMGNHWNCAFYRLQDAPALPAAGDEKPNPLLPTNAQDAPTADLPGDRSLSPPPHDGAAPPAQLEVGVAGG